MLIHSYQRFRARRSRIVGQGVDRRADPAANRGIQGEKRLTCTRLHNDLVGHRSCGSASGFEISLSLTPGRFRLALGLSLGLVLDLLPWHRFTAFGQGLERCCSIREVL